MSCKYCGKKTKLMYSFNQGEYCEKHYEIGKIVQDKDLNKQEFEQRVKLLSEIYKPITLSKDDKPLSIKKHPNIWGCKVPFIGKYIDYIIVFFIRPKISEDNLEIIDKNKV